VSWKSQSVRGRDVTIDSNWVIAIGMALLFGFIAFLLGWSIRDLLFGRVDHGVLQHVRSGRIDTLTYVIGAVCCFLFVYLFQGKHLKIAFLLLGAKYLALVAMVYIQIGAGARHSAAIAGVIASQIAYAIILLATVQWIKVVIRLVPPGDHGVSAS
jgi:hypothetical protein